MAVFQYFCIICQRGASANAFAVGRIASLILSKLLALIHGHQFHI